MVYNYQNFDLVSKFHLLAHIFWVIVEKLKGGSDKGEILVVFKLGYFQKKSRKYLLCQGSPSL